MDITFEMTQDANCGFFVMYVASLSFSTVHPKNIYKYF